MKISRSAFTMVELVFVIVVLGILAAVAVPKLAATRDDANIAKARSDIASIRSAIVTERQSRLIRGDSDWINSLSSSTGLLFDGNGSSNSKLLMYGIASENKDGHWRTTDASFPYLTYVFKVLGADNTFIYNPADGTFDCNSSAPSCNILTK